MTTRTNGELQLMQEELVRHLTEIKEHVKTTNGRVKKLELWRMLLVGGFLGVSLSFSAFGFIIYDSIRDLANLDQLVADAVDERLSEKYEIIINK